MFPVLEDRYACCLGQRKERQEQRVLPMGCHEDVEI
jgi:hypothetical protein